MTKLPVKKTTRAAWGAVRANVGLLLRLALVPFVVLVAIDLLAGLLRGALYEDETSQILLGYREPIDFALRLPLALLGLAVQAAFIGQVYRLFLLGRQAIERDGLFRFGPEGRRLFIVLVAMAVLTDVPFRMEGVLSVSPFFMVWNNLGSLMQLSSWPIDTAYGGLVFILSFLIYLFAGWAVAVRLAFLFPSVCLGRPWDLKALWRETKGNGWRLFVALLRVAFLVLLIGILVESAARDYSYVIEWFQGIGRGDDLHQALAVLKAAAGRFCSFAIIILWAAITTIAFAQLTSYPAEGVRLPMASAHPAPTAA